MRCFISEPSIVGCEEPNHHEGERTTSDNPEVRDGDLFVLATKQTYSDKEKLLASVFVSKIMIYPKQDLVWTSHSMLS